MKPTVPWSYDEIRGLAAPMIGRLHKHLKQYVAEFTPLDNDDVNAFIRLITCALINGTCQCGGAHCAKWHNLACQPGSGLTLKKFLRRAIFGPQRFDNTGFMVKAVVEGMFLRYLRQEIPLCAGLVVFKTCHLCVEESGLPFRYEGGGCPKCKRAFDKEKAPIVAREWLFLTDIYSQVPHFHCRSQQVHHYYLPERCLPILNSQWCEKSDVLTLKYLVRHGVPCDQCPLAGCGREHPQNYTMLWVRSRSGNPPPDGGEKATPPDFPIPRSGLIRLLRDTQTIPLSELEGMSQRQLCEELAELLAGKKRLADRLQAAFLAALQEWDVDERELHDFLNPRCYTPGKSKEIPE